MRVKSEFRYRWTVRKSGMSPGCQHVALETRSQPKGILSFIDLLIVDFNPENQENHLSGCWFH